MDFLEEIPGVRGGYGTIVADCPWRYDTGQASRVGTRYDTLSIRELCEIPISGIAAPESHLYLWTTTSFLEASFEVCRAWGFEPKSQIVWVKGRTEVNRKVLEALFRDAGGSLAGLLKRVKDFEAHLASLVTQVGFGSYVRVAHEYCLLGVRGGLTADDRSIPSVFVAPRGRHSAKPEKLQDIAEDLSPGPRLELFARRHRPGWRCVGNEL